MIQTAMNPMIRTTICPNAGLSTVRMDIMIKMGIAIRIAMQMRMRNRRID